MPKGGGGYRLFAFVRDDHGGAAVANMPLLVKGPVAIADGARPAAAAGRLRRGGREMPPYVPTGWMGNTKAMKLDEACTEQAARRQDLPARRLPRPDGWAGVVWQNPGERLGRPTRRLGPHRGKAPDLLGPRRRRAAKSSPSSSASSPDKKFPDTARGKLDKVTLDGRVAAVSRSTWPARI